jgi:undecaprenyl pyrophosphate synthase
MENKPETHGIVQAAYREGEYAHFHRIQNNMQIMISMYGNRDWFEADIEEDENGDHWCWYDAKRNEYCMFWPSEIQLETCFTYGTKSAEKAGQGRVCRMSVKIIKKFSCK